MSGACVYACVCGGTRVLFEQLKFPAVFLIFFFMTSQTYPADCRKIAAVDSNKHDWD